MRTLQEVKAAFLEDGVIDSNEAKELEAILFEDGKIDAEEAETLFEINDAVSGKENSVEWNALFVKAITSYLLEDENTPGEVDEEEAEWLYNKINSDGQVDGLEKELLLNLRAKAKSFPAKLAELL